MAKTRLFRYDDTAEVISQLDPLSDVMAWIRGLRSAKYTADILRMRHGYKSAKETRTAAKHISAHARVAVDFLEQAFAGSHELSFLPLYYGLANLAKASIVIGDRLNELRVQRRHGAYWSGIDAGARDLIKDHITLMPNGVFPLLYKTLTGSSWLGKPPASKSNPKGAGRRVYLKDVYPFITTIGHEYINIYKVPSRIFPLNCYIEDDESQRARVTVQVQSTSRLTRSQRLKFKFLAGMRREDDSFVTPWYEGPSQDDAKAAATKKLRRYLLYDAPWNVILRIVSGEPHARRIATLTPLSGSNLLLPEELPILMAFFHLSNVVRYDPERLRHLFDSKAAALLETLIRHGTFRYLLLFWSHINRTSYHFAA